MAERIVTEPPQPRKLLASRVALVTGGGRGLGAAIAFALAREGAAVAVADIDFDPAKDVAAEIFKSGARSQAWRLDVTMERDFIQVVAATESELGPIDILITAAGIASSGRTIAATSLDEFQHLWQVHTIGSLLAARAVLPGMNSSGRGDIVFISSVVAQQPGPHSGPYSMAKCAVEGMARTLAVEERHHGIRCNIIAPTFFDSRLAREILSRMEQSRAARGEPPVTIQAPDPSILAQVVVDIITDPDPAASGRRITVQSMGEITVD